MTLQEILRLIAAFRDGTRSRDRQVLDSIDLISRSMPLKIDIDELSKDWQVEAPQVYNRLSEVNSLGIVTISRFGNNEWIANEVIEWGCSKNDTISQKQLIQHPEDMPTSVFKTKAWQEIVNHLV